MAVLRILIALNLLIVKAATLDMEWTGGQADGISEAERFAFHAKKYPLDEAALESDPSYSHFFNGSYAVHDVLSELLNNKSLTKSSSKR